MIFTKESYVVTVFQFSGIGSPKEEETLKDSLVIYGVPKDTMEENLGKNFSL